MQISLHGIHLIQNLENFKINPYRDIDGNWTIGFGHKILWIEHFKYWSGITRQEAAALMMQDLAPVQKILNTLPGLNQNQYDALCSFIYNVGITNFINSKLMVDLKRKDFVAAAADFIMPKWYRGKDNRVLVGKLLRRRTERFVFMKSA